MLRGHFVSFGPRSWFSHNQIFQSFTCTYDCFLAKLHVDVPCVYSPHKITASCLFFVVY